MKKTILSIIFLTLTVSLFAKEVQLPEFEENENAVVFDARTLREDYDDYIKLINLTDYCNISFEIYGMRGNRKNWIRLGEAELNGLFDETYLKSKYDGEYDMFRYFAVVPMDEDYYSFDIFTEERFMFFFSDDTLVIAIGYDGEEPDTRYRETASIIEVRELRGDFEDNIKIINRSDDRRIDILVYGFDDEDEEHWTPIGYAYLKDYDDEDFVNPAIKNLPVNRFKYYAAVAADGTEYEIDCFISHDDLCIEIY